MSLQKRFFKANNTCKVTFRLSEKAAKGARKVKVVGDFNNWNQDDGFPMALKKGEYAATIDLEQGKEYQFRYLIDDTRWENDWDADKYVLTPLGVENSVVITEKKK